MPGLEPYLSRKPAAFLMDEPLSNLDAKLRVSMRAALKQLRERLGTTTVHVTHDQVEAMTLGDRVCVLQDGRLQQADTPQVLFDNPVNLFVAGFIRSPAMNFVAAGLVRDERGARHRDSRHLRHRRAAGRARLHHQRGRRRSGVTRRQGPSLSPGRLHVADPEAERPLLAAHGHVLVRGQPAVEQHG
jgi:ABC-type sugar transport system ATPase subunit